MRHELLSPAGDMRSVIQAVQNGADAIYVGGKSFGARAFAQNFSYDELKQAAVYAHTYGVKIYVTVNTLVYENETEGFFKHIEQVCRAGADALIMQDVGMISQVRRRFPDIAVHASTQMHNHNDAALCFAQSVGAVRAVLAREMNLSQIKSLQCDIEKEVFIHGALCICYSGQCLFSALTNGRSGNRGTCAQSCRMRYKLCDDEGKVYHTKGEYLLSPKDIGLFEDIKSLIEAGVGCFKIEGRMKSPEYVGLVTKIYKELLKAYESGNPIEADASDTADLLKLFNRGYSKGHLLDTKGEALMSKDRPNHRGTPLGRVVSAGRGRITIQLSAPLRQGDGIKFERSDDGFICNKVYKKGLLVACAQAGDIVELDAKAATSAGDTVVKTSDSALAERLQEIQPRCVGITAQLTAKKGELLRLVFSDTDAHSVIAEGDTVAQSRTRPTAKDELQSSISKLGDTPYKLLEIDIDADEDIFIAKSALNALRREAVLKITEKRTYIAPLRICDEARPAVKYQENTCQPLLHVLVRNGAQFEAVRDIVTGDIYTGDEKLYLDNKAAYSNMRLKTDRLAENTKPYVKDRLLVTDHGGLHVYPKNNDVVLDHSVYAANSFAAAEFVSRGVRRIALAAEMDEMQTLDMVKAYKTVNGQMPPLEAILYARHELMVMRHCVLRGALGENSCKLCKRKRFFLKDIKGSCFPIITDESCKSHIYHARPTLKDAAAYSAMGIRHFRVELFDEDAEQSAVLVKRFLSKI